MRRPILAALVAATMLAGTHTAARADLLDDVMKAKKLRVSTDVAIPPSGMIDGNLKPTGSDVEVAELLAKDLGLELEFVQTTGATRIPNVQTNKADLIVSTLSVTPERGKVIDFTKPYAKLQSVVGCLKTIEVKDWPDLKGRTIAVARGTTQDTAITGMRDRDLKPQRYDDDATLITAAVSGQADCVASSATIVAQIGIKNASRPFEPKVPITIFDLAMGVRKGETRFVEKLNAWIQTNTKNGKLNAIYRKFHGTDLPPEMRGS